MSNGKDQKTAPVQGKDQKTAPVQGKDQKTAPVGGGTGKGGAADQPTSAWSKQKTADSLSDGKKDSDAKFSQDKKAGATDAKCQKERWLKVRWDREEAYCGDQAKLIGTSQNLDSTTGGQAEITVKDQGTADSFPFIPDPGWPSFTVLWQVHGVDLRGKGAPDRRPAVGKVAGGGLTAETPKALAVKRVPDKAPQQVSFKRSSPKSVNGNRNFGWTAAFKLGIEGDKLLVRQTLQVKKAWLGHWTSFDAKADKLKQSWGYVKKDGTEWKYWEDAGKAWKKLPRNVSSYTLNELYFVKSGSKFVGVDDASSTWPEGFSEPGNYEQKKKDWLKNIHEVWDGKFKLQRKECPGSQPGCCEWSIDIKVNWSENPGDKLVYAVWAADSGRSDASHWFLGDPDAGMAGHECGHLLGAYDEYKETSTTYGAVDPATKLVEDDSIMGRNLTVAYPRHLDGLRDQAKKKVNSAAGRSWDYEIKKV